MRIKEEELKRIIKYTTITLFVCLAVLCILHLFFYNTSTFNVKWFNLDKERNLPTWFSGTIFALLGSAALAAFFTEIHKNSINKDKVFYLSFLWIAISIVGFLLSLDEMTILHENLFWREIRLRTDQVNPALVFVTQWQVLFAPLILGLLIFFLVFFSNRFRACRSAFQLTVKGITGWLIALFLESIRTTFIEIGSSAYNLEVIFEEYLETGGTILLISAVLTYIQSIAFTLNRKQVLQFQNTKKLFTKRSIQYSGILFTVFCLISFGAFLFGQYQASTGAAIPSLHERALQEQSELDVSTYLDGDTLYDYWFDSMSESGDLSDKDAHEIVEYISSRLISKKNIPEPTIFAADNKPKILFLTISDGSTRGEVLFSSGENISEAVKDALIKADEIIRDIVPLVWIKVDFVDQVISIEDYQLNKPHALPRSLYGFAFEKKSSIAFVPEELVVQTILNSDNEFRMENAKAYSTEEGKPTEYLQVLFASEIAPAYRFTTKAYFSDGELILPLYRGHRLYGSITSDEIMEHLIGAGDYLKGAVEENGKFVYAYLPKTDAEKDDYNILRHAGTVFSMLDLYSATEDKVLLEKSRAAIDYLVKSAQPCPNGDGTQLCIVEDDEIKLGGNGLAVLALAKYAEVTGDRRFMSTAKELANWIVSIQEEDGEFSVHKLAYPDGIPFEFRSEYYPGEALFALIELYKLDGDEKWLNAAEKGAEWQTEYRLSEGQNGDFIHDHWLLYALNEIYRFRSNDVLFDFAMLLANDITSAQNVEPEYADWYGSYYEPPRSTPTATRTEGLLAAYQLARDFGKLVDAEYFLTAIENGVIFQLQTQFMPETVIHLIDPQRSFGGFHRSLTNYEIRIDYVQHNISSLLGYHKILTENGF